MQLKEGKDCFILQSQVIVYHQGEVKSETQEVNHITPTFKMREKQMYPSTLLV